MRIPTSRALAALLATVVLCAGCATSTTGDSRPLSPAQMKQQSSKPG